MMARPDTTKHPAPPTEGLAGEYFAWHGQKELRLQHCQECSAWIHPPQFACPACGGARLEWVLSSGRGVVFSWTVTHRPFHPAFAEATPYLCVIVTLDEGPRVLSMLRDIDIGEVVDGLPVVVDFEVREGGSMVAVFVPAAARHEAGE
jgi:uncharacterized OB-fold protein